MLMAALLPGARTSRRRQAAHSASAAGPSDFTTAREQRIVESDACLDWLLRQEGTNPSISAATIRISKEAKAIDAHPTLVK
jgi:hypothetical protein